MDEPALRAHIQKLTKRLLPKFEEATEAKERVRLVLEQPDQGYQLAKDLGIAFSNEENKNWPKKNEELAKRNREDGNAAFGGGNHELAITLYTEAMKYAKVHETLWEGETMAIAAANRSACYYQLAEYTACLTDIELAVEAGYPTTLVYKLYIRQCKCLLEMCRIPEAQEAFDKAIDAIDRSGLKKDLRKGMATDLQEAFINLAKSVEQDPLLPDATTTKADLVPPWGELKEANKNYPAASASLTIKYDPVFGRHVVANRDIEVGEVIINEAPIVYYLNTVDEDVVSTPACHHCLLYIRSGLVPCPTCCTTSYCSIKCRNAAHKSYHKYECRIASALERTQLHRLPLVMASLRAIAQKPVQFFISEAAKGAFDEHNVQNGADPSSSGVYYSADYRNLFNLVTHDERRTPVDNVTKFIIAGVLHSGLKASGYFDNDESSSNNWAIGEAELLIGKLLAHFLQCIQFNMHMVESFFSNRMIAPDSETRIWKNTDKFNVGEFVETTPLGGAIYPTLANVNHSCDPNFTMVNFGSRAVAVAVRKIKAGTEIHDSYGAVYYYMDLSERQHFLQASYWFECQCDACVHNWPGFSKLPRDYLKLSGSNFKYKRCNRKELQKDVDKIKKRIRQTIVDERVPITMVDEMPNHYEAARKMFTDWMNLLDELLVPGSHQDFVNVLRGIRNCLWLQSPNIVKVKECDVLKETKAKAREAVVKAAS